MRTLSAQNAAALAARKLLPRDFLWIVARDRETSAAVPVGFWSDLSTITASVLDPDTGSSSSRSWYGAGSLIRISDIPAVSNLTVQEVTIVMSQLDEQVEEAVRLYDVKLARVQIFTGLLDPDTRKLVAPAFCRFDGFVDRINIRTGTENEEGEVTITCVSHTQELMRANPSTRSHADQQLRDPDDFFFVDAAVTGEWQHYWGEVQGKINTKPKGLFGWNNFLGFL